MNGQVFDLGEWGPLGIVLSRAIAGILAIVPSSPILVLAGAAEGVLLGAVYVLIGAALGALVAFKMARYLGRDFVNRRGWIGRVAQTRWE